LIYCLKFYELYSGCTIVPQLVEQSAKSRRGAAKVPQVVDDNGRGEYRQQLADWMNLSSYRQQTADDKVSQMLQHLEELGLPMGITDYELKKVLPTKAQLAKCVADAEKQIAITAKGGKK